MFQEDGYGYALRLFLENYQTEIEAISLWIVNAPPMIDKEIVIEAVIEEFQFDWRPNVHGNEASDLAWAYRQLYDAVYSRIEELQSHT